MANTKEPKFYLVGGAVRDRIIGKIPKDYDFVVVGATEQYMKDTYGEPVGNDFPVWLGRVPKHSDLGICEIAMARKETKTGEGHKGFSFDFGEHITLEEDLQRRDFTINAIAEDMETGEIIDFFGGVEDIENKIIREANTKAFTEDALRVLRMARFSAKLEFKIHSDTMELAKAINISNLTTERVWWEINKSLATEHPRLFFDTLRDTGHLQHFFPELVKLIGLEHRHEEDAYEHTMMVLQEGVKSRLPQKEMFGLLTHDLGKGETPKEELPKHHDHDKRSMTIIRAISKRWAIPTNYTKLALWFAENHMRFHNLNEMNLGKIIKMASQIYNGNISIFSVMCMVECDQKGRIGENLTTDMKRFVLAHFVIMNTKADEFVEKGFKGKQIGDMLHQKRVENLKMEIEDTD